MEIEAILILVQPTYLQHYTGEQWFPRRLHAVLEATSLSYCSMSALMAFPTKQSVLPPALLWRVLTKNQVANERLYLIMPLSNLNIRFQDNCIFQIEIRLKLD